MRKPAHPYLAAVLAVFVAVLALEAGLRVATEGPAAAAPVNDVLFLAPDRVAGWKLAPDLEFHWRGRNPYCVEFGADVRINRFGFRDREWTVDRPEGTTRIALLGDSMIEALQVPEHAMVARRLEAGLDAALPGHRVEAMNFGISNHSVGQYLMVYEQDVRPFRPDVVAVLASYMNFNRTTQPDLSSRLQDFYTLRIRPSYSVAPNGRLTYVEARDYERYVASVQGILDTEYADNRTVTVLPHGASSYVVGWTANRLSRNGRPRPRRATDDAQFEDVAINYRILEALAGQVEADGGRLVFVDVFDYFERYGSPRGSGVLAARNRDFLTSIGALYVDLSPALWASPENPQFECDMHFSPAGHQLVADALVDTIAPILAGDTPREPGGR